MAFVESAGDQAPQTAKFFNEDSNGNSSTTRKKFVTKFTSLHRAYGQQENCCVAASGWLISKVVEVRCSTLLAIEPVHSLLGKCICRKRITPRRYHG